MSQQNSVFTSVSTILLIIGTVFLVVGYCLLTFWGKPVLENAKNSMDWPTTPGVIVESAVKTHSSDDGTTYSAAITYEYQIDGALIKSDNVWFGGNFSSSDRSMFEKIVNRYPVGETVDVYYDLDDPFVAVLEPGAHFSSYVGFIMGWAFTLIGTGLLLVPMAGLFWKRKAKQQELDSGVEF